jgi:hypothetical protein
MPKRKQSIEISSAEYGALLNIHGLSEDAHMMVMCAGPAKTGNYNLEGYPSAFEDLTHDLADEIEYRLSPQKRLKHLERLLDRLAPGHEF